jgi:hypothetical protein
MEGNTMTLHALKKDDSPSMDDEERLDQMLEDSFPASDPPSTTPMTSLGGREHRAPEDPIQTILSRIKRVPMRVLIVGVSAVVAIGVIAISVQKARKPKAKRRLLARAVPEASRIVHHLPEAAHMAQGLHMAHGLPAQGLHAAQALPAQGLHAAHALPARGRRGWRRARRAA